MDRKPRIETELVATLRINQELKRDIKITAIQRGMREFQLIEEVWKFWKEYRNKVPVEGSDQGSGLAVTPGHQTGEELGSLAPHEAGKLLSVLRFLRNPEQVPPEFRSVLGTAVEAIHDLMGKAGNRGEPLGEAEGPV